MPKIIFDTFNPNKACLVPKAQTKPANPCVIKAQFHVRGGKRFEGASISFVKEGDHFVVQGSAGNIGLLRSLGFSESNSKLQGNLYYSIGFQAWFLHHKKSIGRSNRRKLNWFVPTFSTIKDFLVLGEIFQADPLQKRKSVQLLKGVLALTTKDRAIIKDALNSLEKAGQSNLVLPGMRPRIQWLKTLLVAYESFEGILRKTCLTPQCYQGRLAQLRKDTKRWFRDALIYLATGHGSSTQLLEGLDNISIRNRKEGELTAILDNIYKLLISHQFPSLQKLHSAMYFQNNPLAKSRLKGFINILDQATVRNRAELLSLPLLKAYSRSLQYHLVSQAEEGNLNSSIKSKIRKAKFNSSWLRRKDNIEEILDKILPAFRFQVQDTGPTLVRLDVDKLKRGLERLIDSHSIKRQNYLLGALAVLRYIFGSNLEKNQLRVWEKNRWVSLDLHLSPSQKSRLKDLFKFLEKNISDSFSRGPRVLPWLEAGVCVAGLGLAGAGIGTKGRPLTVSGSTTSGLGCGSLITHFIFRKSNHYLTDTLGGLLGAGTGFTLSWVLTRGQASPMTPPPNPPPRNPGLRNETDEFGP